MWRTPAADNPAHQLGLTHALTGLGVSPDRLGDHIEQLKVAREEVACGGNRRSGFPGLYRQAYLDSGGRLQRFLASAANEDEVINLSLIDDLST